MVQRLAPFTLLLITAVTLLAGCPTGPTFIAMAPTPTPIPVPEGYLLVEDETRGYALAVPTTWTEIDLRDPQFLMLSTTFGMGDELGPLQEFLDSPAGESLGSIYVTDMMSAMFGGLPTGLAVYVVDAPGATPAWLLEQTQRYVDANHAVLGEVEILDLKTTVVNGRAGIRGSAIADLASIGVGAQLYIEAVALIEGDKLYILTLASQDSQRERQAPVFDQIIGTFRPE